MQNESFEKYSFNLKTEDNCIWKPIKIRQTPNQYAICNICRNMGKKRQGKVELFAEYFSKVFLPHNYDQDHEVEQTQLCTFSRNNA